MFTKGTDLVVKGTTRRVVIVRPPDSRIFEQAIFIVRESASRDGVSADEIVRQANRAANKFAGGPERKFRRRAHPLLFAAIGALATAAAWGLSVLLA